MQKKSLILLFLVGYFFQVFAQEDLKYQKPSAPILALADYERPPSISMDKDKNYMLLLYRDTYKSLDELNQDELRLAGLRINPNLFVSSTMNYVKNLKIT